MFTHMLCVVVVQLLYRRIMPPVVLVVPIVLTIWSTCSVVLLLPVALALIQVSSLHAPNATALVSFGHHGYHEIQIVDKVSDNALLKMDLTEF